MIYAESGFDKEWIQQLVIDMAVYTCTYDVDLEEIVVGSLLFLIDNLIVSCFYRR